MKNKISAENYQSSISLCQPSCGYYFSSGLVVSETVYSSAGHGAIYNAASRIIIDGGRKALQTAALGGMMMQNLATPVYAGNSSGVIVSHGQTITVSAGETWISTYISGYSYSYSILNVYGTTSNNFTGLSNSFENVLSGGIANGTVLNPLGYQDVSSGGTANSTIVHSSGWQTVSSGGIANGTIVNSGGMLHVESGGSAINIKQNVGGRVYAIVYGDSATYVIGTNENGSFRLENGVADNFVINSRAIQDVLNGGIANSTLVNSRGSQEVMTGGTANRTIVNYFGTQTVHSGGTANSTILSNGGWQTVYNGGIVNVANVESGGSQIISSGGLSISATINSGAYQNVSSGGIANGTIVNSGGWQVVHIIGIVNSTTVNNGGYQVLDYGGTANGTIVNSGGQLNVSICGTANDTVINLGGYQNVSRLGIANGTIVNGGYQNVSSGGTVNGTILNIGGYLIVSSGGKADNITQNIGGNVVVNVSGGDTATYINGTNESGTFRLKDGVADSFILYSNAEQTVYNGGIANDTVVNSSAYQKVSSGGIANGTIVNGGYQNVYNGGIANGTVADSGYQAVFSGGVANSTLVNSRGYMYVSAGGVANDTKIKSGGFLSVESGGKANNITQSVGATIYLRVIGGDTSTYIDGTNEIGTFKLENGVADNFLLNSGYQKISSGGVANSTIVNPYGSQFVYDGGSANGTIVNNLGNQYVSNGGAANSIIINYGGSQHVSSGGLANNAIINSGGKQYLSRGGTARNTVINVLGSQVISDGGLSVSATINSGGKQYIESAGVASDTTISIGGWQFVENGGFAINNIINSGALQTVKSGGVVSNTVVQSGGSQVISSGGSTGGMIISGTQYVSAGATDISATVSLGGIQHIAYGASTVSATVSLGGTQIIHYGGSAVSAIISNGGGQNIFSGGMASGTVVSNGGTQNIGSGGSAVGTEIDNGGIIRISPGGIAANLTANNGGTAIISGNNILYGDNVLSSGGQIKLSRQNISTPVVLAVNNLSAGNGTVAMNMNFAQPGDSDKIVISGTHTGNAIISINSIKGIEPVQDNILLVEYSSGATANGTFSLECEKLDAGWYEYTLERGNSSGYGNDYYLRNSREMTPIAKTAVAAPAMGNASVNIALNSLQKRLGDLRSMGNGTAQHGTWARGYYQSITLKDKIETEMKVSGIEAGYDLRLEAGSSNGEGTYLGIMAGKTSISGINGKGKSAKQESKGDGEGILGGAYLTYIGEDGSFADLTARIGTNKLDLSAYSVSEENWLKFSPERKFIAASIEAGKRLSSDKFQIEPKAEIQYMDLGGKEVNIDGLGEKIKFGRAYYLTAIGTFNGSYSWKDKNGYIVQPYAEISYSQELKGDEEIIYIGKKEKSSQKGGLIEGRIGINMQMSDNVYWHAAASMESGSKREGFGADAGIRYMFGKEEKANQKPKYEIVKDKAAAEFALIDKLPDVSPKVESATLPDTNDTVDEEVMPTELENVRIPMAQRKNHNAVAVIIGAKDYDFGINPVAYAHNDALLVRDFVIKTFGYDKENIIYVEDPTKANLEQIFGSKDDYKAQLNNWIKPGKSDVFIYYAGHGAPDQDTRTAYFVPKDANPDYIKIGGYAMETLYANLAKLPARSITVVTDVCFSGQDGSGKMIIKSASPLAVSAKIPIAGTGANSKITVFNASKGSEIASWYDAKQHGLFTYYFLLGISGEADKDKNKTITAGELDEYLQEQVPYRARRLYNREQHPMFIGNPSAPIAEYK